MYSKKLTHLLLETGLIVGLTTSSFAAEFPVTIKHSMGDAVIKQEPTRVVSLMQGATDALVAFKVTPVGSVESWSEKPMYKYLQKGLQGTKYVGMENQPSLEDIASLKPDLIISAKTRQEKVYPMIAEIAPTVVLDKVFDFKQTVEVLGEALGKQEQANKLLSDYNNRVVAIRTKLKERYADRWPLKASFINVRNDHMRVYADFSFAGAVLKDLGFKTSKSVENSSKVLKKLVSKEAIPTMDADVFYVTFRNEAAKENYKLWQEHPLWKQLTAAKNKDIYEVDSVHWLFAGGILAANRMLDDIESTLLK